MRVPLQGGCLPARASPPRHACPPHLGGGFPRGFVCAHMCMSAHACVCACPLVCMFVCTQECTCLGVYSCVCVSFTEEFSPCPDLFFKKSQTYGKVGRITQHLYLQIIKFCRICSPRVISTPQIRSVYPWKCVSGSQEGWLAGSPGGCSCFPRAVGVGVSGTWWSGKC